MAHDPKKCSDPRAEQKFLFTSSYWECPSCDNTLRQTPNEEKTDPGVSWAGFRGVAMSGVTRSGSPVVGSSGMSLPAGHYVCQTCGDKDFYVIDAVASGQTCSCGGGLARIP